MLPTYCLSFTKSCRNLQQFVLMRANARFLNEAQACDWPRRRHFVVVVCARRRGTFNNKLISINSTRTTRTTHTVTKHALAAPLNFIHTITILKWKRKYLFFFVFHFMKKNFVFLSVAIAFCVLVCRTTHGQQENTNGCETNCNVTYLPICGTDDSGKTKTFSNECVMKSENCLNKSSAYFCLFNLFSIFLTYEIPVRACTDFQRTANGTCPWTKAGKLFGMRDGAVCEKTPLWTAAVIISFFFKLIFCLDNLIVYVLLFDTKRKMKIKL